MEPCRRAWVPSRSQRQPDGLAATRASDALSDAVSDAVSAAVSAAVTAAVHAPVTAAGSAGGHAAGSDTGVISAGSEAGTDSLAALNQQCAGCQACPLAASRQQVVVGRGNPQARLLLIGEGPGAEEDASGQPFVGRSGQLLDRLLAEAGLDPAHDLYIANIVKCRPPQNRRPTAQEMAACRPWLDRQIALIDPPLILLAGATAMQGLLGIKGGISRLRGQWQPWQGRQLLPLFHPAYLLRQPRRGPGQPIDLTLGDLIAARERLRAQADPTGT